MLASTLPMGRTPFWGPLRRGMQASWKSCATLEPSSLAKLTSASGPISDPFSSPMGGVPEAARPSPLCRSVSDAVEVLDAIVGFDEFDKEYTESAVGYIPKEGYKQFLQKDGLRGKCLSVVHTPFFNEVSTKQAAVINTHLLTMGNLGAEIIENVTIDGIEDILSGDSEYIIVKFDFKTGLNRYLEQLLVSPVRSLADIIQFNIQHAEEEKLDVYGQDVFLEAQNTRGPESPVYREALKKVGLLTKYGIEKVMSSLNLDAIVAPTNTRLVTVAAIAGYQCLLATMMMMVSLLASFLLEKRALSLPLFKLPTLSNKPLTFANPLMSTLHSFKFLHHLSITHTNLHSTQLGPKIDQYLFSHRPYSTRIGPRIGRYLFIIRPNSTQIGPKIYQYFCH